jgi:hypothetical protein
MPKKNYGSELLLWYLFFNSLGSLSALQMYIFVLKASRKFLYCSETPSKMATSAPFDPCAYVSLSKYDWALYGLLKKERGLCHGVSLTFNPTVWCLTIVFHTLTIWLALGVNLQLFLTFKRRNTLYFW